MVLGKPPIIMLPSERPAAFNESIRARTSDSSQGIFGPAARTWFTPSCLTRRMLAASNGPMARVPPGRPHGLVWASASLSSRASFGVSGPSMRGQSDSAAAAFPNMGVTAADTVAACNRSRREGFTVLVLAKRDYVILRVVRADVFPAMLLARSGVGDRAGSESSRLAVDGHR